MKYSLAVAVLIALPAFVGSSSVLWAAPCNCQSAAVVSQPVTVHRGLAAPSITPTSHLVYRPTVTQNSSNPIDIRIGQPVGQTFRSYEVPLRSSVSNSVATVVADSYAPVVSYGSPGFTNATIVERRIVSSVPAESSDFSPQPVVQRQTPVVVSNVAENPAKSTVENAVTLEPLPLLASEPPRAPKTEEIPVSAPKPMDQPAFLPLELSKLSDSAKKSIDLRLANELKVLAKRSLPESGKNDKELEKDQASSFSSTDSLPKRMTLSKPEVAPTETAVGPAARNERVSAPLRSDSVETSPKEIAMDRSTKMAPPPSTLRGQSANISSSLQDIFTSPPPLPQGQVNPGVIPETLLDSKEVTEDDVASVLAGADELSPKKPTIESGKTEKKPTPAPILAGEAKTNGTLLIATIMSIVSLVFMIVIAIDYYQRWLQSLTSMNNRFSMFGEDEASGGYDFNIGTNSFYGDSFLAPSYYTKDYLEPTSRY